MVVTDWFSLSLYKMAYQELKDNKWDMYIVHRK